MSLHNWRNHWTAWLLDASLAPVARLDDLISPRVSWFLRDEFSFSSGLSTGSPNYSLFDEDADQFILFQRRDTDAGMDLAQVAYIGLYDPKWKPERGKLDKKVDIAGEGGIPFFLGSRVLQADPAGADGFVEVASQPIDDAVKDLIRLATVSGTAYDDPSAVARHIPGFTVAADKSEHPTSQGFKRTGNLWDVIELICLEYDIDLSLTPTWNGPDAAVTLELDTHYQGRGADNGVFLNDLLRVYTESSWHSNRAPMKTHGYLPGTLVMHGVSEYASRFRREVIIEGGGTADIAMAMQDMRAEQGHTFGFRETQAVQVGVDLWLGDTLSHHDTELNTTIRSGLLGGVEIGIAQDELGSEDIRLTFGDKEPKMTDRKSGGRRSRTRDPDGPPGAGVGGWYIYGDTPTNVGPNDENAIGVIGDGLTTDITETAASNLLTVSAHWARGANVGGGGTAGVYPAVPTDRVKVGGTAFTAHKDGDTMLQVAGDIELNRYLYAQDTSLVLYGLADTLAKVHVGEGGLPDGWLDVYSGDGTARWRYNASTKEGFAHGHVHIRESAFGVDKITLDADNTQVTWAAGVLASYEGKVYQWPTDAPAAGETLTIKTAAATNLLEWAAPTPAAHGLLSAQHSLTVTQGPVQGAIIRGNATPEWGWLAIGAVGTFLASDGTDPAWRVLAAGDVDGLSDPGTCTVATANAAGTPHTHAVTTSAAPGANARILASTADGYLELVQLHIGSASTYLVVSSGLKINAIDTNVRFAIGGTNYVTMGTGAFKPWTVTSMNLGTTTDRWAQVNGIAGNFTGDVNIGTAKGLTLTDGNESTKLLTGNNTRYVGNASPSITALTATALTINGHITVTGNVDGVKVATHHHAFTTPTYDTHETGGDHDLAGHHHQINFTITSETTDSHTHDVIFVAATHETNETRHHHGVAAGYTVDGPEAA